MSSSKTFPALSRKGALLFWTPRAKMECPCQDLMIVCFSGRQLQQVEGALWCSEVKTKGDVLLLVDACRAAAGNLSSQSSHQWMPAPVPSYDGYESQALLARGHLRTSSCSFLRDRGQRAKEPLGYLPRPMHFLVTGQRGKGPRRLLDAHCSNSTCSQLGGRSTDNTQAVTFLMGLRSWSFTCLQV